MTLLLANQVEEIPCSDPDVGETTSGFKAFSLIYAVFCISLTVISTCLWYKYRKIEYLKKRGDATVVLFTLAFIANIFVGPLKRVASEAPNVLNSCVLLNITFCLVTPGMILPEILKVVLFRNRVLYNQKLAKTFSTDVPYLFSDAAKSTCLISRLIENNVGRTPIDRLRYYASRRFGRLLSFVGGIILLLFALLYTLITCPAFGLTSVCQVVKINGIGTFLLFMFPLLMLLLFLLYFWRRTRTYPDPFGILREVRNVVLGIIPTVLVVFLLTAFDVGGVSEHPISYTHSFLYDAILLSVYSYSIPYQVYQAKRLTHLLPASRLELSEILAQPIGRDLFRKHLINEFSVENLHFYEAVTIYKNAFDKHDRLYTSKNKLARNIFNRFIQGSEPSLNLPHAVKSAIQIIMKTRKRFDKELFDDVLEEIVSLMENDSFSRFKRTKEYTEFIGIEDVQLVQRV